MDALQCLLRLSRAPPLLSAEQLLACQPRRLLAASCALYASLPAETRAVVCLAVCGVLFVLWFHEALSGHVRSWLAPPPLPPAAAAAKAAVVTGMEEGVQAAWRSRCGLSCGTG